MATELTKREDGMGFRVDTHNFSQSMSAMSNTEDLFCCTSSYSLALTKRQKHTIKLGNQADESIHQVFFI